ncbi:uncharacterized protein FIBRA_02108 [Fibroporia radiculosa]|uniref:Probable acetate kinase n=1 Tax=Fibroporia radiculosa TaxID=599839 RepID=J4I8V7_9APHY|nr:uncharacterized protein FIBRA_02108 [Fibroporia radiculosa]CCM00081.1 predicted protein [Fibroporia radiculosa]
MPDLHAPSDGLILALNAGSSSLKITLFKRNVAGSSDAVDRVVEPLLFSNITNLSSPPASFTFKFASHGRSLEVKKRPADIVYNHASAFAYFLDYLDQEAGIDRSSIVHVCHRVVHGGDYFEPVLIDSESYHHIETLSDLAPLHNGAALSVIKKCIDALPNASLIAYFDTSFHRSIPLHIASYAINTTVAHERGLKKYGFHGLSYAYILSAVSEHLERPASALNLIVMHLGSGASVCAIEHGASLDTSMGLTPLSGLPGATRSGAVDPSLIFHYTNRAGRITHDPRQTTDVRVTQAEEILNMQSGWKALAGTPDFGEVVERMKRVAAEDRVAAGNSGSDLRGWQGEEKWKLAFDLFVDRICGFVGAYYVRLGGKVDALVFSGGIGEKSAEVRDAVVSAATCLGFGLDITANTGIRGKEGVVFDIGSNKYERQVLVCRTNEQLEMAKECALADKFWK